MNLYPETMETQGARVPSALYDCPGFTPYINLAPGPIRAEWSQNGLTFMVSGFNFYQIDADGTQHLIDVVAVNSNPATITGNGDAGGQILIVSGNSAYCYTIQSGDFQKVIDSGATQGDFLDGFFLVLDATSSTLKVSAQFDGTTWDSTQEVQRSQGSDRWLAMKVVHSDIWLLGEQTSEVWYDAGTSPFPFEPRPGAFIQQGAAAAFTLAQIGSSLMWLSHNEQGAGQVMMANGYAPQRISTHAIEFAIQGYADITDAVAFAYQQEGHDFYVLTFPSANATWVYDVGLNIWHARGTWNPSRSSYDAYRPLQHCHTLSNQHLVGDRLTGDVYTMSTAVATEVDGTGIRRQRRFVVPTPDQNFTFLSNLQIYGESGVGLPTGQGADPQMQISWSKDGGHTFSGTRWTGMGKQGQYAFRSMVRGVVMRARNPVIDVVCSEPVPTRWLQALVDVESGSW